MTTYTPEQVQELVIAAERAINHISPRSLPAIDALNIALAPFRPDPDAEGIDAMCLAWTNQWFESGYWESSAEPYRERHRRGMRAALAAYRDWEASR